MLKTLEKIRDGKTDFTSKEIRLLATHGYGKHFAKIGEIGVLERILKSGSINDEDLCACFGKAAEAGQASSIETIFANASETALSAINEKLDDDYHNGEETFSRAMESGSLQTIDVLVDHYLTTGGSELLTSVLENFSIWDVDTAMLDQVLYLAHQYGGPRLTDKILGQSENLLEGAIYDSYTGKDKSDLARQIVQKLFSRFGEEKVIFQFGNAMISDDAPEKAITAGQTTTILAALDEVRKTCGIDTARKVLEIDAIQREMYYVETAALYGADDILEAARNIAKDVNDTEFTRKIEATIDQKYGLALPDYFENTVKGLIAKIDSGEASNQDPQEIVKQACEAWVRSNLETHHFPVEKDELPEDQPRELFKRILKYDPILMRESVLEDMLEHNDWHNFSLMCQLMEKALGTSASFEIMEFFENAAANAPDVYKGLAEYALENAGPYFVQRKLDRPQDTRFFALGNILGNLFEDSKNDALRTTIDLARRAGGDQFVQGLIIEPNYFTFRKHGENGNYEGMQLLLNQLDPEQRATALSHLPDQWSRLYDGTISKSDFWQEYGAGAVRWREVTGEECPDRSYEKFSPFRFRPKLYEEILPLLELDADINYAPNVKWNAYKLSVMFSNREEVERYLSAFADTHPRDRNKSIIHAACAFGLPLNMTWSPQKWKPLLLKHGARVFEHLPNASLIERFIADDPFPKTLRDLRAVVAEMRFERSHENPTFAKIAARHWRKDRLENLARIHRKSFDDLMDARFNFGLDLLQNHTKTSDQIPSVFIDGDDVGHPDFYMTRLAPDDPTGLILGDITNDCQTIFHNGHECAIHGMTSEYGGFYVWRKKTEGQVTDNDQIVAQSWAWIGADRGIVFDSFERGHSAYARLCQPFLEQYAHEVIGKHKVNGKIPEGMISAVRLGEDGDTPALFIARSTNPSEPIDYEGKSFLWEDNGRNGRESHVQYEIPAIDHRNDMEIKLAPAQDSEMVEAEAERYIKGALKRIEKNYGIVIKTGIEIECYACGSDGESLTENIDAEEVQKSMQAAGLDVTFEDENTVDFEGQYEITTKPEEPFETLKAEKRIKAFLEDNASSFGVDRFDFSTLPFANKEASSKHISFSLWSKEGNFPLFANPDSESHLITAVARGVLEMQKYTTLLNAETDVSYKRFGHSEWAPNGVGLGDNGIAGTTLRLANRNNFAYKARQPKPEDYRIENRLLDGNSNSTVAMAAMIAGIEYGLSKFVHVFDVGQTLDIEKYELFDELIECPDNLLAVQTDEEGFTPVSLPKSRYHALQALMAGLQDGPLASSDARTLFEAVLDLHGGTRSEFELDQEMIPDAHIINTEHPDDSPHPV